MMLDFEVLTAGMEKDPNVVVLSRGRHMTLL